MALSFAQQFAGFCAVRSLVGGVMMPYSGPFGERPLRFAREGCMHDSNPDAPVSPATPPKPPLFPNPGVLDEVLYDYLRRADRMGWSPYDLVSEENMRDICRPERLSEVQRGAVKTVLFVEDHLPGYLSEYLRVTTDPTLPDDQYIVNRQALHYTFRWVAEEDRHAHVLEMYLTKSGLVSKAELEIDRKSVV